MQPMSVHGQPSIDVEFVWVDDPDGGVRTARIGPEAGHG
jgi:hypothetical protein